MTHGDIYAVLEQEHREMEQLLNELSEQFNEGTFKHLAEELASHTGAEEKAFYDAVIDAPEAHEPILEGYEEHHVVDLILRELKANEHGTERWMAKFKVLKENVEHHIEEEESIMFDATKQVVSEEAAARMAEEFDKEKKRLA